MWDIKKVLNGQYAVFSLGKEKYGVGISYVREITKWEKITNLPGVPRRTGGVLNLRGEIVPIIYLREYFGLEPPKKFQNTKIVVLDIVGALVGINVDNVEEVVNVNGRIHKPPYKFVKTDLVSGIAELKDDLLILLNLESAIFQELILKIKDNNSVNEECNS